MLSGQRAILKPTGPAPAKGQSVTIRTEPVYDHAKSAFMVVVEASDGALSTVPVDRLNVARQATGNLVG